ncbi:hypothetical protein B7463_g4222, partial [Scytalidium lignicola]
MDETGFRVGITPGEEVIVLVEIKELYEGTFENRKSVTVIECVSADGKAPIPPVILVEGNKLLLVDGHESHEFTEFIKLATKHHIIPLQFPSHLMHIIQPLDVKVFRPYKYYHKQAVREALTRLESEYTVTSFLRDLNEIRKKTFTEIIVRYAFRESGIWPIEVEKTLAKLRVYSAPDQPKEPEPTLPTLPATPKTARHSVQALEELETRIPEIKKIYLEDLKEWRAKEKERKAAIRRITQGRKIKQHLVPAYLLVETPNKPVDPTTLQGTTISINEEQEVDFILDSTYNFQSSQYTAVENVVERPGTVLDDPWVTDITHTTTATATATATTTATKPLWLDQDFMEFE